MEINSKEIEKGAGNISITGSSKILQQPSGSVPAGQEDLVLV